MNFFPFVDIQRQYASLDCEGEGEFIRRGALREHEIVEEESETGVAIEGVGPNHEVTSEGGRVSKLVKGNIGVVHPVERGAEGDDFTDE